MILRPYQSKGKILTKESFQKGNTAVLCCVPTGGGKTVMFSDMAKESIYNGVPTMIVCDRKELIDQAEDKLNQCGLHPTLIVPSYRDKVSNLYLASVDTLRNRPWPKIGYLIPDECHERKFDEICLKFKKSGGYISGFTASPIRSGKAFLDDFPDYTGQLCDIYDDMVIPTTVSELIKGNEATGEQYLVPSITYSVKFTEEFKTSKSFGETDYSKADMFAKANNSFSYASVVNKYIELTSGTKALCFNINVEHSIRQAQEFNLRGIPAAHVDGSTPLSERKKIFKDFKFGIIKVLCNVGVATKGYDESTIETIIINRKTMSLSLWLQMCGRGGRPCPEIGKNFFNIIDMYGNVYSHLWWEYEHDWSLKKQYVSKTIGVAPIKECEHCQAIIPIQSSECPHCKMLIAKREQQKIVLEAGEFEVVDKDNIPKELKKPLHKMTVDELERFRAIKEYQVGWAVRQLMARGIDDLREYARIKNYTPAWVDKQIGMAEKGREEIKQLIWKFIQDNPQIDEQLLKDYASKKLKSNHSPQQIETLLPLIVKAFKDFHAGLIKVE
jgi:superfamily II DNA or RNA helicase